MSPSRLTSKVNLWQSQLPSVKPFYAVKCNPDPHILHQLYDAGIGFDCASTRELLSVRDLGRSPSDISGRVVYANPCKSERDLQTAAEVGSPTTVVDSVGEVVKLTGYQGGALVRIAVDDTTSAMPFSSKFGAKMSDVASIAKAAEASGLALRGISFHVGSGCYDGRSYAKAIEDAYKCLVHLAHHGHPQADTIDIGGGYLADQGDFTKKAAHIREAIMKVNMNELDEGNGITWIAEPGRFFATHAFDFFVQVIGKKWSGGMWTYTIDDSLYGQFSSILFDHASPTWVRIRESGSAPRKNGAGVIFGRTCDSVDVIAKAEHMEELEVDDWLWFPTMGAYTRATASEFNGFPRPEVFVDDRIADLSRYAFHRQVPKGVHLMPPVTSRGFWS